MLKWDEVCKRALYWLKRSINGEVAYFYGAKGQVLTDELMEALWQAEPKYFAKYTKEQKKAIFNYSRGKIGLDCSGLIALCFDDPSYSLGIWAHCHNKTTDLYSGPAGSVLIIDGRDGRGRHIGVDIGYGFYIHTGRELHGVELGRIKDNYKFWNATGLHNNVDYTGATNR